MKTLLRIVLSLLLSSLVSSGVIPDESRYCEFYDPSICSGSEEACTTIKKCPQEGGRNHCFVVWTYDNVTKISKVIRKDCWDRTPECYDKVECIDTHNRKRNSYFCCCDGDMCNHDYSYEPKPTEPTIVTAEKVSTFHQHILTIILPSSLLLLVIVLLSLYLWYRRRKSCCGHQSELLDIVIHSDSPPRLDLESIELLEVKATGRFGVVWKAELNNESVAVKVFTNQCKKSWQSECEIFKLPHMKHENILQFIGSEQRGDDSRAEFWLMTAYHEKGSLHDYLKSNVITWSEMCKISESMTRGLMHLHEEMPADEVNGCKPAVAHRDFKSKNVLLKSDMRACIADFGMALVFQPDKPCGDAHGQIGTWRYMAPEVLDGAINFTRDSFLRIDMYALGLVLWELASRCTAQDGPVGAYRLPFEAQVGMHPTLEDMREIVAHKRKRPLMPETWRKHSGLATVCDTIEECWDHEGEARLSASCVVERIADLGRSDCVNSSPALEVDDAIASEDIKVDDAIASEDIKVDDAIASGDIETDSAISSGDIKIDEANESMNINSMTFQMIPHFSSFCSSVHCVDFSYGALTR